MDSFIIRDGARGMIERCLPPSKVAGGYSPTVLAEHLSSGYFEFLLAQVKERYVTFFAMNLFKEVEALGFAIDDESVVTPPFWATSAIDKAKNEHMKWLESHPDVHKLSDEDWGEIRDGVLKFLSFSTTLSEDMWRFGISSVVFAFQILTSLGLPIDAHWA